jgi:hypothetical protein
MSASEESAYQHLSEKLVLETAITDASDNLDTDIAAIWTHNKNEVSDRMNLFNKWRRQMCSFIGIPPGPWLGKGGCQSSGVMHGWRENPAQDVQSTRRRLV